jgi:hypothetical protein
MVPLLLVALLSGAGPGALATPDAVVSTAGGGGRRQASPAFGQEQVARVCVVANLPEDSADVEPDEVRRIFLMRQQSWPDGPRAHPVNLPASSPVRDSFSRQLLGQTVEEMVPYWNDRYFHGTRPPPSVASQEAVLLFVARTPGGVGYVDPASATDLPDGVRTLFCLPDGEQSS